MSSYNIAASTTLTRKTVSFRQVLTYAEPTFYGIAAVILVGWKFTVTGADTIASWQAMLTILGVLLGIMAGCGSTPITDFVSRFRGRTGDSERDVARHAQFIP